MPTGINGYPAQFTSPQRQGALQTPGYRGGVAPVGAEQFFRDWSRSIPFDTGPVAPEPDQWMRDVLKGPLRDPARPEAWMREIMRTPFRPGLEGNARRFAKGAPVRYFFRHSAEAFKGMAESMFGVPPSSFNDGGGGGPYPQLGNGWELCAGSSHCGSYTHVSFNVGCGFPCGVAGYGQPFQPAFPYVQGSTRGVQMFFTDLNDANPMNPPGGFRLYYRETWWLPPGKPDKPPLVSMAPDDGEGPGLGPAEDPETKRKREDAERLMFLDAHAIQEMYVRPKPRPLPWALLPKRPYPELRTETSSRGGERVNKPPLTVTGIVSATGTKIKTQVKTELEHRQRPGERVKERKFIATIHPRSKLGLLVSGTTEMIDFLECAWKSLPIRKKKFGRTVIEWDWKNSRWKAPGRSPVAKVSPGYRPKAPPPQQMLKELYDNAEYLDADWFNKMSSCLIEENLEDAIFGTAGAAGGKAGRIMGRPVGPGTGPAL